MSLFSKILEKLNIKKPTTATATVQPAKGKPGGLGSLLGINKPAAIAVVDVVARLEEMSKKKPGLDWKVSIVDLLKLLDMDSSFANRKELAVELGCPEKFMGDSAAMNTWLHKAVLQKIAENGGNIPQTLLD